MEAKGADPMRKPAIVFDLGGVLIEWKPQLIFSDHFPGDPSAVDAFLSEIRFPEWNVEQDKGRSFAEGVSILKQEFPRHAGILDMLSTNWEASLVGQIEGSVEILRSLKERGFRLYGLSNWSQETFTRTRVRYPFLELFDDILISGEVCMVKPDPGIFELCLNRIGRPARECLFIDDSRVNIATAENLGFEVVHFVSPEQLRRELSARGIL